MKQFTFLYLLLCYSCTLFAQQDDTWIAFWNNDTTLIGFKDQSGKVRIEPKFVSAFMSADHFDHIIAAIEEKHGIKQSYYLTKEGKVVGRDSLHVLDFTPDCESEGFIRFREKKTENVGMFNRKGEVVIPAEYNELSNVRNGLIIALKGATKDFWDKDNHSGCNHFNWKNGRQLLLDTNHNILIEDFVHENPLNLFSLAVTNTPHPDTTRKNFRAIDGRFYSFIDFEKEFRNWFLVNLLNDFTKEKLETVSFLQEGYWSKEESRTTVRGKEFLGKNFELISSRLLALKTKGSDYYIFDGFLSAFESNIFPSYYNNCGEVKEWIYPVKSIVINYGKGLDLRQDHFDFLRTEEGYKLISVSITNSELK